MSFEVKLLESDDELELICDVMLELRDTFTRDSLVEQMRRQREEGYQLAYVIEDGKVVCVAGFVIGTKLAWGRHIYIDDLVTSSRQRSSGAGAAILDWFYAYAREQGCTQIQLDSGVQRFRAHRFYLRHGFVISSHHFTLDKLDG